MNFLSLFSGIGGLDLGLERAGMRCVAQVEIDPFCRRVLTKHWPDVPRFEDVRTVTSDALAHVGPIDLIAGGFPCQDISTAGHGVGIGGERSGLWREFGRLIRSLRPRFVLVENVSALLGRGMGTVLGDLASCGYDAEWDCIPAAAVGAPHIRDRVFIIAHADEIRRQAIPHEGRLCESACDPRSGRFLGDVGGSAVWHAARPIGAVPMGVGNGVPEWLDRIGAYGNAVVPQVAEWIGRRIMEAAEALGIEVPA